MQIPIQIFLSALIGALAASGLIVLAGNPQVPEVPPMLQTVHTTQIYTCDTLPDYQSEENPAIRELRATCQAAAEALLLIEQWQNNPQVNIVYE